MNRVIARPAAVRFTTEAEGTSTFYAAEAVLTDEWSETQGVQTLVVRNPDEVRMHDLTNPEFVEGELHATVGNAGTTRVVVSSIVPDDAVAIEGLPNIPLPPIVIAALRSGEVVDSHIEALVESDGYVATVLLVTDMGLWTRYASTWVRLADVDIIDGMQSVAVEDSALELYDAADQSGNRVPIESLLVDQDVEVEVPSSPAEIYVAANSTLTFAPEGETGEEPPEETAAEPVIIATARDLPGAIERAVVDPSIRWYVEKRARALDPKARFPWQR